MRTLVVIVGLFAIVSFSGPSKSPAPRQKSPAISAATPLILEKDQGEERTWRPLELPPEGTSDFMLKVDSRNGNSQHLVMGVEDLEAGGVIDMHKHLAQDEIVYLQNGTAHVSLGGIERDVHGDATVFIPEGTWISFKNIGAEPIHLVYVFSHPGFDTYMRCASVPYGQPALALTPQEDKACQAKGHVMYK
ncbi:MAG TPA: cupin domain-containing protein [Candidatus Acidoferrales bacterium]|nr:cupin domain-containing protein [Candidatus Acidoferrales bacterium]